MILHLGDGKWGQNHKRILSELGVNFVTEDLDLGCKYENLLSANKIDGLILTTSTINHYPIAQEAIGRGIPVFCEKPICTKPEQLESLKGLNKTLKPIFMGGHQLLFDPSIQKIALQNDTVYMNCIRAGAIPRTEGAVMSLAVHDVALAHFIFNIPEFTCIEAQGNNHTCKITLMANDYVNQPNIRFCEIYVQSIADVRLRHLTTLSKAGVSERLCPDNWNRCDLLKLSLGEFIGCIANQRQPKYNSLTDCCAVMETVFKIKKRMEQSE